MRKEHKFKYRDKVFLFILENSHENKNSTESPYPYISCTLYRQDMPQFDWIWSGYLMPLPEKIEFHLIYDDQINIKGFIHLFESLKQGNNDFIFMDTQFGYQYEEHFEGNVFKIGDSTGNIPIPPDPIIPIVDKPDTLLS